MSILKRFLTEDLIPLIRKRPPHAAARNTATARSHRSAQPMPPLYSGNGRKTVILNWKAGENDPFTVMNRTIGQHFRACGMNVESVEIAVANWPETITELAKDGIQFAFTWQGLGSQAKTTDSGESLWNAHRIPLMCIHADHPSHMPMNHSLENRYCFHLYTNAEFARYSNRHFRTRRGASVIDIPQLHRESSLGTPVGDHFVVTKNINHPDDTEAVWRKNLDAPSFHAYMSAAETLKSQVANQPYVDVHDALDDLIRERRFEWLNPASNIAAYHQYHRELDFYIRNWKSVKVVESIRQFPAQIFGRGWDRVAKNAPERHRFAPGRDMADSQNLYYSRFGLIDVSPSKGLHDRTRRAMANGTGFLSSANLEDAFPDIDKFAPLFFTFESNQLAERCAAVIQDPEGHQANADRFAHVYHARYHFKHFVNRLDQLAMTAIEH